MLKQEENIQMGRDRGAEREKEKIEEGEKNGNKTFVSREGNRG